MTIFQPTLQCEKGYACTHISILHYLNVDPLALSSHLYSESHSFDHCGLVINGDDKVESVVIMKLLGIPLALYPGSLPLPVQAWVRGYYPTKTNSISII